jgi:hypothetical protein
MASGEVLGFAPGIWDELAAGTPETDAPVGVMTHPDSIHRTAVFVTRTSGGVGGGRPRGPSLSRLALSKNIHTLRAMRAIPEMDWKQLRALKTRALNDACARILDAVAQILQKKDGREHEAYLELWELLQNQDHLIASLFDDFKRSTAFDKLAAWQRHGLVSESDLVLFTEATQATVKAMNRTAR